MEMRTLRTHLRRAFTSPAIYICIALYTVMLLSTTFGRSMGHTVLDELVLTQYSFCFVLSTVFPALAYAVTYVDDYDNRLLHSWVMRCGAKNYAVSYYAVSVFAGFIVSFAACALFIGIMMLRGLPLDRNITSNVYQSASYMYTPWYLSGPLWRYVTVTIMEYALGCAAMAGFSAACSTLLHRRISAVVIPVLYFFVNGIIFSLGKYIPLLKKMVPEILNINQLTALSDHISGVVALPLHNFLFKCLLFALYAVLFGTVTVWCIERSIENA